MSLVVTGLSADGNIDAVKTALTKGGFSLDPLQAIGADDSHEPLSHGLAGGDLITSGVGTTLPGLGHGSGGSFFRNESLSDRLGDLAIPDSEMDNYLEAVERGKTVIAYFAHADSIDAIESIFRAANLLNVRRY
jgi:hypothetical protein